MLLSLMVVVEAAVYAHGDPDEIVESGTWRQVAPCGTVAPEPTGGINCHLQLGCDQLRRGDVVDPSMPRVFPVIVIMGQLDQPPSVALDTAAITLPLGRITPVPVPVLRCRSEAIRLHRDLCKEVRLVDAVVDSVLLHRTVQADKELLPGRTGQTVRRCSKQIACSNTREP